MDKIERAFIKLEDRYPYLSSVLNAMVPVKNNKVPTMAVDKYWRMYWNEEWTEELTQEEVEGVIHHELNHLLFEHSERFLNFNVDHDLWNVACDLEINSTLQNEEQLPQDGIFPKLFELSENLLAEKYLDLLIQAIKDELQQLQQNISNQIQQNQNGQQSQSDQPQPGQGQQSQSDQGQQNQSDQGQQSQGSQSNQQDQGPTLTPIQALIAQLMAKYQHGSGNGQNKGDWELDQKDPNYPGKSELEKEVIKERIAKDIQEHQRQYGNVPGDYLRIAEKFATPKSTPWQALLKNSLFGTLSHNSGGSARTYRRANRRSTEVKPVVLPGRLQRIPSIAVIVDNSGSVDDEVLSKFYGVAQNVIDTTNTEVWALIGDMQSNPKKVKSLKGIKPEGGGGTDMGALIQQADQLKPHPDVILCLTDGETPWGEKPKAKLITIIIGNVPGPEWGKTIYIK